MFGTIRISSLFILRKRIIADITSLLFHFFPYTLLSLTGNLFFYKHLNANYMKYSELPAALFIRSTQIGKTDIWNKSTKTPKEKIKTPKEFLRTAFGFQRKGVPLLQEFVYRIYGVFRQVRFHDFALFYSHFIKPFLPYLFRKFEMRSRHSG